MNERSYGILGLLSLAVIFVLLRKFFPSFARLFIALGGLIALGVVILVIVVIFFAFRKPKKSPDQQICEDRAAVIKTGRIQLMEIRRLLAKIKHPDLCTLGNDICTTMEKILHALKEHPDDIPGVGRFFRYYLPTLQSILTKYLQLESRAISDAVTEEKTISCLTDMRSAMEKQYINLFENDKLDLAAEMAVMTQLFRQDGLLTDHELPL